MAHTEAVAPGSRGGPTALLDDRRDTWFGLRGRTYDARLGACVDAVIGIQRERWYRMQPAGERVRVRMGISSGEASQTTAALPGLLRYRLMANAGLKDLGLRCMNGMGRPERILQLQAEGLAAAFRGGRSVARRC